jgi:hypothetical protein
VFEMIIAILGIVASAIYVGFLALKIYSVPLWVIVIATYVLVIREFAVEYRSLRSGKKPNGAGQRR